MGVLATHPVFLPGKCHGQRSLVGYSPWGCKALDTTEHAWTRLCTHARTHGCFQVFVSTVEAPGCIVWAPLLTAANCSLLGTGVSWCRPESRDPGLAAQALPPRSLVTGKLSFHLLSENCQALLTRGEMGKPYFLVTDLQKYFTYLGYTSPYCLYPDILSFPICGLSSHFVLFPLMKRSFYFKCTVLPQRSQWTGFRTCQTPKSWDA